MSPRELPIWQLQSGIVRSLTEGNRLVLVAATGSGKTTQVPQMLLDHGLAGTGRVVVLQPRRVAARSVATRVAWERGGRLGDEVGYQVRFEDRIGAATRLAFVTEGILLRWLQDAPELDGVGAVVFDEFHERNLLSDVALAWVKRIQATRRPDLRVVVMSATLEARPVAEYLGDPVTGDVPVLESEGRTYPVEVRWSEYGDRRPAPAQAAEAVERIVTSGWEGDVLVFMPGMAEIQSTLNELRAARLPGSVELLPLHGDLPPAEQDRVFQPSGRRRVIVSTNVAETSVTIDGIRHVVDSGLARVARYDAERGIQTLAVEEISRASAEQRAGRAGRTAPGTCWRLWTESGHLNRAERNTPEIRRADLAEVVLLLHSLGVRDAAGFDWLDRPDPEAVRRAERLLTVLGALDAGGALTDVGRRMLRLPMHPRFARMLVEASRQGCVRVAALCAALVSGRDLLVRPGRDDRGMAEAREVFEASEQSDFHTLLRAHQFARNAGFQVDACRRRGVHAQVARMVEDTWRQILQVAGREGLLPDEPDTDPAPPPPGALERCLLAGFVDQIAVRCDRGSLDCRLSEDRRATLMRESVVQRAELLVAASIREIDSRGGRLTLLGQCTAVDPAWLTELFPQHLSTASECVYDRTHRRVAALRVTRFLDLEIGRAHERDPDPDAAGACLAGAFARGWLELPNLDHRCQQFLARVGCVHGALPGLGFPEFTGEVLQAALGRAFRGLTLAREAQQVALLSVFESVLGPELRGWLDELAPMVLEIPGPGRCRLTYAVDREDPAAPAVPEVQVKLSECLRLEAHPAVVEGRVPVRLWLQGPDGKRLGGTTDWARWRQVEYPKLRPQLKSRYPGLLWP